MDVGCALVVGLRRRSRRRALDRGKLALDAWRRVCVHMAPPRHVESRRRSGGLASELEAAAASRFGQLADMPGETRIALTELRAAKEGDGSAGTWIVEVGAGG